MPPPLRRQACLRVACELLNRPSRISLAATAEARWGKPAPCPDAVRHSSSKSRWKARQGSDMFSREAKVQGLKSRAAFKLLEMDAKYKIFKKGQTVVDLVAMERTKPTGRVLGIDLIPAQPPRGVSTIQGNFLSPQVQAMAKAFLAEPHRRAAAAAPSSSSTAPDGGAGHTPAARADKEEDHDAVVADRSGYIDLERASAPEAEPSPSSSLSEREVQGEDGRLVDVVLSDMSAPWPQTSGFSLNTLSNPHARMMNTSGTPFRDHAGSMDLCAAALSFACDSLRVGGHLVCKFYQGNEDKALENRLKRLFAKVHREKPESSRSESREAYFVALRRKGNITLEDIEG